MINEKIISTIYNHQNNIYPPVRSFVRRNNCLTEQQKYILNTLWFNFGINYQINFINLNKIFDRKVPLILEIGFGMGDSLVTMANISPEINFLGIEVYLPGIKHCLTTASLIGINNLRVIYHDAIEVLQNMIPNNTLTQIQLFYPDPWPKLKHHKRRIIQLTFIKLIERKLIVNGIVHIITDCKSYAEYILKIMSISNLFSNCLSSKNYIVKSTKYLNTKFEKRGKKLGHNIYNLIFVKINN